MVSADQLAASEVRENLKENQRICEEVRKAVPPPMLEVLDLSREVIDTKRDNAKLWDRTNDLKTELDKTRTSEHLASDRVKMEEACVKTLKEHIEASNLKYSKTVENAARAVEELCLQITSLVSEHKI